ncbi:hypothetical protein OQA88_6034 [Cercophora sp. LCS_1]
MPTPADPRSARDLTLTDWLTFVAAVPLFGKCVPEISDLGITNDYLSRAVLRWPVAFTFRNHGRLWRQSLALSFLKTQRATFPRRILRWLVRRTSTGSAIATWCAKHGIAHRAIPLTLTESECAHAPSTTLHCVTPSPKPDARDGRKENGPVILYLHGGGYVNPLRPAHLPFIHSLAAAAASRAQKIYILEYALAPEHPYPSQFVQSVAALRYLLQSHEPSDIIVAGDSAGGQLAGAVLAHCVCPSPYTPALSLGGQQLKAVVMVSPFTRLPVDTRSYLANEGRDYLTRRQVDEFKAAWGARDDEIWANLCGTEDAVLGNGAVVRNLLITVGTAEVFLDDCRVFASEFVGAERVAIGRGEEVPPLAGKMRLLVECEDEVHVQVALDSAVGYKDGIMMRAILAWLAAI